MNANTTTLSSSHPSLATLSLAFAPVGRAVSLLATWRRRAADRQHLCGLDSHMLRDVGLSRGDVEVEISKPFWRG
jgi:uncharacterized protein YjiS (DUF1127 family)